MKIDHEWDQWSSDYRSAARAVPPDAARLAARASRDAWAHFGRTALDLAGTIFALAVFATLSVRFAWMWPLASLAMAAFLVSLGYSLHARQGTWVAEGQTVAAFVDVAWRRKRSDVRLLVFGRVLFAILVIGFALWLPYMLSVRSEHVSGRPVRTAFGLVVGLVVFTGTWLYLQAKLIAERRELEKLAQLRADLREDSERTPIEV